MFFRKFCKILTVLLIIPLVLLVRILRPLILIRFGMIDSDRIGAISSKLELYLCKKEIDKHNRIFDLFCYLRPVSNKQLMKMYSRILNITSFDELFINTSFSEFLKYDNVKNNKLESSGSSITEGIGNGRITKNFDKALIDDAYQTNDAEALKLVYDLIEKQKIVLGGSSGINIAGAIKLAKKMGPGKTIVTILCDHGKRYASKIFNKEFLKSKNLPIPKWL